PDVFYLAGDTVDCRSGGISVPDGNRQGRVIGRQRLEGAPASAALSPGTELSRLPEYPLQAREQPVARRKAPLQSDADSAGVVLPPCGAYQPDRGRRAAAAVLRQDAIQLSQQRSGEAHASRSRLCRLQADLSLRCAGYPESVPGVCRCQLLPGGGSTQQLWPVGPG